MRTGAIETSTIDLLTSKFLYDVCFHLHMDQKLAMLLTLYGIVKRHAPIMFGGFQLSNCYVTLLGSLKRLALFLTSLLSFPMEL
jgi:hypothetical protein